STLFPYTTLFRSSGHEQGQPPLAGCGPSVRNRQGVQAALVEAHRRFDILDMHVDALLDRFHLPAQQVAARDEVETFAFELLDGEIDAVAVGGEALNHGSGLLGGFLDHDFYLFDFGLYNLEVGL